MKTKSLLLIICIMYALAGCGQKRDITGRWNGVLSVQGTQLRVVLHITKTSDGYSSTMDSPDQGVKGMHCDNTVIKDDSISISVMGGSAAFKGVIINDSIINGNWKQAGMGFPLVLKKDKNTKTEKVEEINTDSNCVETEIILKTKTGDIFGTLCVPEGFKQGPVAIIIAGSGPTDRDCNSAMGFKTDAYKILAHKLAGNNIATVRYDKRGIAESYAAATSEADINFDDFINDAVDWVKMLKADKRFKKIIIIGHSEGSLIGMIAAKNSGADEYISIAGAGETIDKTIKAQLSAQPQAIRDSAYLIIDSLKAGKMVSHVEPALYTLFRPSVQPFMISWMKYDPAAEIGKLTVPVLIIQGTSDMQVTVDDAKKLSAADKNAKLVLLENMNHIFRIVEGDRQANVATYSKPNLPIDPKLVTEISDFVNK